MRRGPANSKPVARPSRLYLKPNLRKSARAEWSAITDYRVWRSTHKPFAAAHALPTQRPRQIVFQETDRQSIGPNRRAKLRALRLEPAWLRQSTDALLLRQSQGAEPNELSWR